MKAKKFIALAICFCLSVAAIAGCSSSSESSTSGSQTNTESSSDSSDVPDKPSGDSGTTPPDKPSGDSGMGGGTAPGGSGSSSSAPTSYSAVTEYTSDASVTGETFTSEGTDENAILISDGAKVSLKQIVLNRVSSTSTGGDNSSFYGVGAGLLATNGTAYISDSTISTDAAGGAGAFAYGDGVIYIKDTKITTEQDTSGGIHAAGGGTVYAWNLDVTTQGNSSAAIRSDRGGGTMVVEGGSYTSNGTGSPAVYCTADIAVSGATLTANNSEGICIEGRNSLYLYDCNLTCSMHDDSQNDTTWGIIVYQSMSGDSEQGESILQLNGGSINVTNGGVFYTTNTECDIYLSNVNITTAEGSEFFLMCTGNNNQRGWGTSGSNGSDCTFTANDQTMSGDIIWDSVSDLDFYMTGSSTLTGAVVDDETYAGSGGNGYCSMYIAEGATWIVTGNSEVTNLYTSGTIKDASGKTVTIKGTGDKVYVTGDSKYTITVSGTYSSSVDVSGATSSTPYTKFDITVPDELS